MSHDGIIARLHPAGDQILDATRLRRDGTSILRPRVEIGAVGRDSSFLGAFGGLIAQEETPIPNIQLSFPYNINDVYVRATTANGGTVTQASAQAVLQTSANAAGLAQIQSIAAARYTPGQGQIVKFTAVFNAGVAQSQQEIGVGDDADGFFFGFQGATFGIFRRQNSIDTFVPQASWNFDPMDGTGPSRVTLVPTNGNVYFIRYQWLGYGAIRFYVEDPTTGLPQLVHTIDYANANTLPSIFNPSLPLRAKIVNQGNATNLTLRTPSMGAYSEGPYNSFGGRFSIGNRKTAITTETNIITLRCDSTVFGAQPNRGRVHLDALSTALAGNSESQIRIVLNATLGGAPVFTAYDAARSIVSYDTAGTTVTGGRELRRIASTGNFQETQDLSDLEIRINPGDTLTFAASSFGAGVSVNVCPSWHEEL